VATNLQVMRNGIIRGALSALIFFKKILPLTKNILNSLALSDVVFNTNSNNCYKLFKGLHHFAARKTVCKNIFFLTRLLNTKNNFYFSQIHYS
jgi:hypothetical protein